MGDPKSTGFLRARVSSTLTMNNAFKILRGNHFQTSQTNSHVLGLSQVTGGCVYCVRKTRGGHFKRSTNL